MVYFYFNLFQGWNKSRVKSTSKYLMPAPHWHLNTNITKKVTLGILQNGNISTTTHTIDGETVGLCNTCAVDCICQVNSIYVLDIIFKCSRFS